MTKEANWHPFLVARRKAALKIGHIPLPCETKYLDGGIERACKLLSEGYGLIVLYNHFSIRDSLHIAGDVLFAHRVMNSNEIRTPLALHQSKDVINKALETVLDFHMSPLATGETLKKQKYKDLSPTTGFREYLADGVATLEKGGSLMMSPQTTRKDRLSEEPQSRPLATLFLKIESKKLENGIAILFVGIGIQGVTDYSTPGIRGFNLRKKYEVTVGPCYTKEEAVALAGGKKLVDVWAFSELAKVVPPSYLRI